MTQIESEIIRIFGSGTHVIKTIPAGFSSAGSSYFIILSSLKKIFVKETCSSNANMFECETNGLNELRKFGALTPEIYSVLTDESRSFLLMEALEDKPVDNTAEYFFGCALAEMHKKETGKKFGFYENNYIGLNKQQNRWLDSWCEFFTERRLLYQISLASEKFLLNSGEIRLFEKLASVTHKIIPECMASVLHGDLWAGNFIRTSSGCILIDPAVYFGSRETDIAMTELFGGFTDNFYRGYNDTYPLDKDYRKRKDMYNLYHILNHLNIFGSSYKAGAIAIAKKYTS